MYSSDFTYWLVFSKLTKKHKIENWKSIMKVHILQVPCNVPYVIPISHPTISMIIQNWKYLYNTPCDDFSDGNPSIISTFSHNPCPEWQFFASTSNEVLKFENTKSRSFRLLTVLNRPPVLILSLTVNRWGYNQPVTILGVSDDEKSSKSCIFLLLSVCHFSDRWHSWKRDVNPRFSCCMAGEWPPLLPWTKQSRSERRKEWQC